VGEPVVHIADASSIDVRTLYGLLRLRAEIFVVEQDCPFVDPDGRDLEAGARHLWVEDEHGEVIAGARILTEPDGVSHIGRVVTSAARRGAGVGAAVMRAALATCTGVVELKAQSRLAAWYQAFGFAVCGDEFIEDGIPHVPMRLTR
jgi:ElaA protein